MFKIQDRVRLQPINKLSKSLLGIAEAKDLLDETFIVGNVLGDDSKYDYEIVKGNKILKVYENEITDRLRYPSSFSYPDAVKISDEKIDKMVEELVKNPEIDSITTGDVLVTKIGGSIIVAKIHKEAIV
ncbi:MAG: hypothetical protein ACOCRO_02240 [Halanaerobiales bacterium]